ncbi:MAG: NUDIX domain-containing protein [Alphaproteobacteria bacterium]
MTSRKVDILERVTAFQGYFRVDRYRLRHETFDGGMSAEITREIFERGHAAAALPYDPVRDEVVLLEQFRVGAHAAGREPWMIEIVAGIIEDGETPESLVQREMLEEAGLTTLELEPMATILTSPGGASETVHFFCARIDSSDAGGLFGLDHEGEDIRAFVVPGDDVADLLTSGQVENGPAVLALQWFLLNRDRLRQQWAPSAR